MASRSLTLTLPIHIFAWVSDMAVLHNYGSVHKSIRDLLGWAASAQPDDLDWIFGTKHAVHVPKIDKKRLHGQCRALGVTLSNSVAIEARLSDNLRRWISTCVDRYKLDGPSQVFDTVCRCAIELEAGDDIFESAESGRDLATCTADLYHDLGISGFSSSLPRRSRQSGQSR